MCTNCFNEIEIKIDQKDVSTCIHIQTLFLGRESESEMAQEAMKKCSQQERSVVELNAKLKGLMDENTDLKEQLYSALEHHTTKSCDSGNSKVTVPIY